MIFSLPTIYDERDDFNFNIINYQDTDGDCPRATSDAVVISQLTRFVQGCTYVQDFNKRNLFIIDEHNNKVIVIVNLDLRFLCNMGLLSKYKAVLLY